jgi:hypothetical protein
MLLVVGWVGVAALSQFICLKSREPTLPIEVAQLLEGMLAESLSDSIRIHDVSMLLIRSPIVLRALIREDLNILASGH